MYVVVLVRSVFDGIFAAIALIGVNSFLPPRGAFIVALPTEKSKFSSKFFLEAWSRPAILFSIFSVFFSLKKLISFNPSTLTS